jgi:predicted transcriptional regulator
MSEIVNLRGGEASLVHFAPLSTENVSDALSDRNSRRVLASCVDAARSVKEISAVLEIPLASVYRQVHRLHELGVIIVERSAMTPEGKKYDLYRSRLAEAHLDISGDHEAVRWVANDQVESRLIGLWDAFRVRARGSP